jgi:hypothetical protein
VHVVTGAQDPLAVAKVLGILLNVNAQTAVCRQRLGQIDGSLALLEGLGDELAQRASAEQTERLQGRARDLWEMAGELRYLAATLAMARV